jgi:hypothetical protein
LRLPQTSRIIDERLESFEDYMLRKLRLAERLFLEEKVIPSRNQLIRRAVIENYTTKNSKLIQIEIALILKKLEQSDSES